MTVQKKVRDCSGASRCNSHKNVSALKNSRNVLSVVQEASIPELSVSVLVRDFLNYLSNESSCILLTGKECLKRRMFVIITN